MNLFLAAFCILNSVVLTYILTARRVSRLERHKAQVVINQVLNGLRQAFPEVTITETKISLKDNKDNYPYDFESEEKFDQIIKDFDR